MNKEELQLIKEVIGEVTKLPVNPVWKVNDALIFNNKLKLCVDMLNKYSDLLKPKQIENKTKMKVPSGKSKR